MSNPVLEAILAVVSDAFRTAPAWSDPAVKVRQHYRQVNRKPVAQGPMSTLPSDPFSVHMPIPEDQSGDEARVRYYEPAGHALALHARQYGETGPDGLVLSIERVEGQPVLKVTASPAPPPAPEPANAASDWIEVAPSRPDPKKRERHVTTKRRKGPARGGRGLVARLKKARKR